MTCTESERSSIDYDHVLCEVAPQACAMLRRAGVPPADAEDLLQDCLLRLFQVETEVHDSGAWLLAAVRYATLMYWRSQRTRAEEQLWTALETELTALPPDSEMRVDLARCLTRLSREQQRLLNLRFELGLEPIEIARLMGCTTRNVRKRTVYCLQKLKTVLKSAHPPSPDLQYAGACSGGTGLRPPLTRGNSPSRQLRTNPLPDRRVLHRTGGRAVT